MNRRGSVALSFLIGLTVMLLVGYTTDQIIQNVYDSTNTALRANVVAGGGGSVGPGTVNTIAKFTPSTTTIGNSSITDNGTNVTTTSIINQGVAGAANSISLGETAGCITFEGSSADTVQTRLCVANPTVGDMTYTLPDAQTAGTRTIAILQATNSFSGSNTFSPGPVTFNGNTFMGDQADSAVAYVGKIATGHGGFQNNTTNTPDSPILGTGTLSNSWHLYELADTGFDFQNGACGTSACTDPNLIIHSHNQTTTEWISLSHNGTNGILDVGTGVVSIPDGITTAGTIVSTRTSDVGWSVVNAANQACNTTCTSACVVGIDTAGTGGFLACTDATADSCLCAGSS